MQFPRQSQHLVQPLRTMAINSGETFGKGSGLGVLASASVYVSAQDKLLGGELSTETSSERGSINDDDIENVSVNAHVTGGNIGIDIGDMEYVMVEFLRSKRSNPESGRESPVCRLCRFSAKSYERMAEHIIVEHRMAVLRSMHELNMAGMWQQHAARMQPKSADLAQIFPTISSAAIAAILEISSSTATSTSESLKPFVKKILKDGPTAWILEYAKCRKRQRLETPLAYPICPITSRIGPGYEGVKIKVHLASKSVQAPRPLTIDKAWSRQ